MTQAIQAQLKALVALTEQYATAGQADAIELQSQFDKAVSEFSQHLYTEGVSLRASQYAPLLQQLAGHIQQHPERFNNTRLEGGTEGDSVRPLLSVAHAPDHIPASRSSKQPADMRNPEPASVVDDEVGLSPPTKTGG